MRTHTFTESAPCWPLHAIDPRGFMPWRHEPDEFDRQADEDFRGDFEGYDEDDDDYFDCMMGPDGMCGKAGSEECEFDCPTMAAWRRGEF